MRFSVDAHAIGRHLTGNEVYIRNLLNGFAALDHNSEFIAYYSEEGASAWLPERFRKRRVAGNPFLRLGLDLTSRLWQDRPDLVHVQYTAPLACPVPVVVSVHDVSFLDHPEFFSRARATQLRWTVARTVRTAARILTPSEFSRRSIERVYGVSGNRVVVAPNAVSEAFRPVSLQHAAEFVENRFGIRTPFLLTVGDLQPRKNHLGLVRAFAELIREYPHLPHRLALVGKETGHAAKIRKAVEREGIADRVHFTGFVSDDDLVQLYGACELFVFPSFYEGFGLPILEAMACGRAVACSNTSAMPEVANAAAILFDPYSGREMMQAIRDLVLDAELRSRMERLGQQRAALFSWRHAAQKTLEVYYEVAGGTRSGREDRRSVSVCSRL